MSHESLFKSCHPNILTLVEQQVWCNSLKVLITTNIIIIIIIIIINIQWYTLHMTHDAFTIEIYRLTN